MHMVSVNASDVCRDSGEWIRKRGGASLAHN